MKRFFLFLMTFILVLVITTASVFSQGGKTTTLTFWTFQQFHVVFMEDAVAAWNEANPDKQIELKSDVYPYEEMHNKLLISLQAGIGAPDFADIEISMFANYLKGTTPSLVPLNDVVEPVLDNLIKSRFDNFAKDGKYYGIDYHVGATVMYYNTEILGQAGVNVDDIITIEDYVEAEQLKRNVKPLWKTNIN